MELSMLATMYSSRSMSRDPVSVQRDTTNTYVPVGMFPVLFAFNLERQQGPLFRPAHFRLLELTEQISEQ